MKPGSSDFFLITVLKADSEKALHKRLSKQKAILIGAGWPKEVEIKGTSVWGSAHNPLIPQKFSDRRIEIINNIISAINVGDVEIYYSVARKSKIKPHIMRAEYGIAYNYFAGQLLTKSHANFNSNDVTLIVDQRSKETHTKMKFDGYIETRLLTESDHQYGLDIRHEESHDISGLQAVDFLSWGLFRHYEHNDPQFKGIIDQRVKVRDNWYSGK